MMRKMILLLGRGHSFLEEEEAFSHLNFVLILSFRILLFFLGVFLMYMNELLDVEEGEGDEEKEEEVEMREMLPTKIGKPSSPVKLVF